MKRVILLSLALFGLLIASCSTSRNAGTVRTEDQNEERYVNSKLNNKRLEKNLAKFSQELNLSKRQQKDLKRIDRRYARKERRLSRRDETKKRDIRQLASEKREEMLYVLTPEQQQKLEALVKKGRFSFENWFGK